MAIHPDHASPITTGDTGIAIVYRLTDASGAIWRSSPQVLANALVWSESPSVNASGQWIIIPTLRHLLPGVTAQIEIYIGQVDLQLFRVIANDPTRDYIEFCPQSNVDGTYPTLMITIEQAVANAQAIGGVGEVLYTTGGAIPNDPPPQLRGLSMWRNRVMGWFGNRIWVSQEFATGLGIQWSSYLGLQWDEGTGDIIGGCMIDWNYFAIFKKDAIGIIDGQGPDGMGHGNYVIRTLTTKAGCDNPKSLINGADGCYYQDSHTKRLMLLTPDQQIRECMPGAFDVFAAGLPITDAIHVEKNRQVWFFISETVLVLDYKHRTDRSPMGQVYIWPINQFAGAVVGAAIVAGAPLLLDSHGEQSAQVAAQYYDLKSDGTTRTAVNREIETGEISPLGLQRMFNVSRIAMLGQYLAAHVMTATAFASYATSGTAHAQTLTAEAAQFVWRPEGCMRIQSVRIRLTESTYAPGTPPVPVYGAGSAFVGFAIELQDHGKLQLMPVGRIA